MRYCVFGIDIIMGMRPVKHYADIHENEEILYGDHGDVYIYRMDDTVSITYNNNTRTFPFTLSPTYRAMLVRTATHDMLSIVTTDRKYRMYKLLDSDIEYHDSVIVPYAIPGDFVYYNKSSHMIFDAYKTKTPNNKVYGAIQVVIRRHPFKALAVSCTKCDTHYVGIYENKLYVYLDTAEECTLLEEPLENDTEEIETEEDATEEIEEQNNDVVTTNETEENETEEDATEEIEEQNNDVVTTNETEEIEEQNNDVVTTNETEEDATEEDETEENEEQNNDTPYYRCIIS
jgi:hypothetical protein